MPAGCVKDLCVPEKLFLFLSLLSLFISFLWHLSEQLDFFVSLCLPAKVESCAERTLQISLHHQYHHSTWPANLMEDMHFAHPWLRFKKFVRTNHPDALVWVSEHSKDDPWNILIHIAISCILNCSDSELSFNLPLGFGLANRRLLATRAQHQHMLQRRAIIDYTDTAEPICWRTLTPAVLYLTPTCGLLRIQHITHWQSEDFVLLLRFIKRVRNYMFSFLLKVKGDRSPAAIERWANITESLSLKLAPSHITKSPSHCFSLFRHVMDACCFFTKPVGLSAYYFRIWSLVWERAFLPFFRRGNMLHFDHLLWARSLLAIMRRWLELFRFPLGLENAVHFQCAHRTFTRDGNSLLCLI